MNILQAIPAAPAEAPWWVLALVVPTALWFSTQVWPWLTKRFDAKAVQREEEEHEAQLRAEARDERRVKAQEAQAEALGQIRRFMEMMDWRWAAIESYMDPERKGRQTRAPTERERGSAE